VLRQVLHQPEPNLSQTTPVISISIYNATMCVREREEERAVIINMPTYSNSFVPFFTRLSERENKIRLKD